MWLVNVSVMLAVVQWASSAGGSPRLPTRVTPPLVCAWAAGGRAASPNRTATLAVESRRRQPDRATPPPPTGGYGRTGARHLPRPRPGGGGRAHCAPVPGAVRRVQCAALSRERAAGAGRALRLHVYQTPPAARGPPAQPPRGGRAPPPARAAPLLWRNAPP